MDKQAKTAMSICAVGIVALVGNCPIFPWFSYAACVYISLATVAALLVYSTWDSLR